MHSRLREQAVELRMKMELSYGEIRKQLGVSKSTLSYWLRDFPLDEKRILELRRKGWTKGEASRERFRDAMRRKREEAEADIYRQQRLRLAKLSHETLFVAGLVLYLAEGGKTNRARISFANTDVRVIRFFIHWMQIFLSVPQENARAQLHLYANMNIANEERYWRDHMQFSEGQFYKTQIRKLRPGSFSYMGSFRHGTCSIFLPNTKKKTEIMMAIKAFLDMYME